MEYLYLFGPAGQHLGDVTNIYDGVPQQYLGCEILKYLVMIFNCDATLPC